MSDPIDFEPFQAGMFDVRMCAGMVLIRTTGRLKQSVMCTPLQAVELIHKLAVVAGVEMADDGASPIVLMAGLRPVPLHELAALMGIAPGEAVEVSHG